MAEFAAEYGLFLLKALTIVASIAVVIGLAAAAGSRGQRPDRGHIEVHHVNDRYDTMAESLHEVMLDSSALKQHKKKKKAGEKKAQAEKKKALKLKAGKGAEVEEDARRRIYVIDFDGDIKASAVAGLREEITAVLTVARHCDEVVVKLESGGGMVHSYGLAASQLDRLREREVPLTVCIDKVAASGGYMMACIGNKIVGAPFAMIGSVGVVAQIPNFHKVLKKHDVDYELLTAGEYKRTLTIFGENTQKGRDKFMEDLEQTHELFKQFVAEHRPAVDIDAIATGEVWFGTRAVQLRLVDELGTSDQYLMDQRDSADIYQLKYATKKGWQEKLGLAAEGAIASAIGRAWQGLQQTRFFS